MKGNIDLKKFIQGVKNELMEAREKDVEKAFFELTEVEMEAEFSLEASTKAEGGFKMFINLAGSAKAGQTHKVLLKFKPFQKNSEDTTILYNYLERSNDNKNTEETTELMAATNEILTRRIPVFYDHKFLFGNDVMNRFDQLNEKLDLMTSGNNPKLEDEKS